MAKMKMPHTRTALAIFAPHFQLSRPTLAPLLHVSRRPSRHSLAPHSPASRRTLRRRTLAPHSQVSHRPPTFLPPTPFSPRSFLTPLLSPAPASRRLDGIMIGAVSGSSVPGASFRPNPVGPDRRGSSASDAPEAPRPVPERSRGAAARPGVSTGSNRPDRPVGAVPVHSVGRAFPGFSGSLSTLSTTFLAFDYSLSTTFQARFRAWLQVSSACGLVALVRDAVGPSRGLFTLGRRPAPPAASRCRAAS